MKKILVLITVALLTLVLLLGSFFEMADAKKVTSSKRVKKSTSASSGQNIAQLINDVVFRDALIFDLRKLLAERDNDVAFRDKIIADLRQTIITQNSTIDSLKATQQPVSQTPDSGGGTVQKSNGVVVINSHSGKLNSDGYYEVTGEIQNTGPETVISAKITATFYNKDGDIVGQVFTISRQGSIEVNENEKVNRYDLKLEVQ
ncbi:MAG: hypothetical protein HY776_05080 [Actinobacteria bacterium]|nr:hypothetical protein [Actinomycetota bacterium]